MSTSSSASIRRGLRAASDNVAEQQNAIRPFRVEYPESDILEMRRRIAATRWPEKETVSDTSQGVPLALLQDLACRVGPPAPASAPARTLRRAGMAEPSVDAETLIRGVVAKIQGQGNVEAERLRDGIRRAIAAVHATLG